MIYWFMTCTIEHFMISGQELGRNVQNMLGLDRDRQDFHCFATNKSA